MNAALPTEPSTQLRQPINRLIGDADSTAEDRVDPLSVLIIEDHQTIGQLLSDFIGQQPGFRCVGSASSGARGISLIQSLQPDLIMLDLQLGDISGLEVLDWLSKSGLSPKVLIFSALVSVDILRLTLRSKVDAFVEKGVPMSQLQSALNCIRNDEIYFSPAASNALREVVVRRHQAALEPNDLKALRMIGQKQPIKSIAYELAISQSGAYKLVDRLLKKTESQSTTELINVAIGLGLIMPN